VQNNLAEFLSLKLGLRQCQKIWGRIGCLALPGDSTGGVWAPLVLHGLVWMRILLGSLVGSVSKCPIDWICLIVPHENGRFL